MGAGLTREVHRDDDDLSSGRQGELVPTVAAEPTERHCVGCPRQVQRCRCGVYFSVVSAEYQQPAASCCGNSDHQVGHAIGPTELSGEQVADGAADRKRFGWQETAGARALQELDRIRAARRQRQVAVSVVVKIPGGH